MGLDTDKGRWNWGWGKLRTIINKYRSTHDIEHRANKTVGVGNRPDQGGVGGGKYVKLGSRSRYVQFVEDQEQISKLLRLGIQFARLGNK